MTQESSTIPLMNEFDESSLLDQIKSPEEVQAAKEAEEAEAEKVRLAAEEAETPAEKEAREKLEAEEAETEDEKAIRLAKEQEEENLSEEEKAAKIIADKKAADAEEGSFWGDVDKITGNSYEVDYKDTDPDSPEGAAIREEVVSKVAIENNLASLEKDYPKSFNALRHEANGGKFEDLLNPESTNYADITLDKDNEEQHKTILKNYYLGMGLSEAKAVRNVEDDVDSDEGSFVHAEAALKEQKETESTAKAKVVKDQADAKEQQGKEDKAFSENLSAIITKGELGNFKVDKKDAESFYKHVLSQVERKDGGYVLNLPLTNENFVAQLQQAFFGFKKGDLSKYVVKATKTEKARTLQRNIKEDKSKTEESSEAKRREQGNKLPTLGAFTEQ